ncbi:hypothetical protein ACFOWZ_18150 [Lentzea rhizosphaerae]|uniref:Transcriptional regulator, AbiEi antitoxin, Type IV TA system n=1 Tax=Lentzea rhizosphaerae TaxID=2041025 RepID=A0ABV8BVS1_9PSEU
MRHPIDLEALGTLFVHRVAPVAALIHIGLSPSLIDQRSRPGGPWQRLFPGIFLLSRAGPSREQLVQAALFYAGERSMLTAFDALYLHGMRSVLPTADAIHVLAPRHSRAWGHATLRLERTDRLPKPAIRRGFHVAPLERAAIDAIRRTRSIADTKAILEEATHYVGVQALRAELAMAPRKGTTLARKLLGESPARQLELAVMERRHPTVPPTRVPLPTG